MAEVPRKGVFLAGATGSGKSTFQIGMYATLAGGMISGCSLHCRDRRLGLELLGLWDEFADTGKLPPITARGVAVTYPFTFKLGIEPWLDFDIMDYRGGVFTELDEAQDEVAAMLQHLSRSSSIYLVLDSSYLTAPITTKNRGIVTRKLQLNQLADPLDRAIAQARQEGRPAPSVVFLLTKSDKLRPRFSSGIPTSEEWRGLIDDLEQLMPLVFSTGISALVCPVRIGRIDKDHGEADPKNLHLPIAFTLLHHLQADRNTVTARLAQLQARLTAVSRVKDQLDQKLFKFARVKAELAQADQNIAQFKSQIRAAKADLADIDQRTEELARLLDQVPILQDGLVVNMDLADPGTTETSDA
ncbi:hypothetical protein [Streptomyces sp. NPDC001250]|uniref:hypothetical protein n=1 Tax=unclassified Streptomyces TaxID=2593676 RepID=UPI003333D5E3